MSVDNIGMISQVGRPVIIFVRRQSCEYCWCCPCCCRWYDCGDYLLLMGSPHSILLLGDAAFPRASIHLVILFCCVMLLCVVDTFGFGCVGVGEEKRFAFDYVQWRFGLIGLEESF